LFFQVVLLCGYAYAHALTRWLSTRRQAFVHSTLLVLSLAVLPIVARPVWRPTGSADPTGHILLLLGATVGLPYFLLSSSGPLLQSWLAREDRSVSQQRTIYRLFALSNLGSLAGLLVFPFLIEPLVGTVDQARVWSVLYVLYVLGCALCAWRPRREVAPQAWAPAGVAPRVASYARWIGCGALATALLVSITTHLAQNIASIPFLWVLPLSIYLLSFVVVFEGRGGRGWYSRRLLLVPAMLATATMAWAMVTRHGVLDIHISIPLFCVGLFIACCVCHGEVAASKPSERYLTHFYLSLAAGGAIGAVLVSLAAPRLFSYYWETSIALIVLALLITAACIAAARPIVWWRWLVAAVLGGALGVAVLVAGDQLPGLSFEDLAKSWSDVALSWHIAALCALAVLAFVLARLRLSLAVAIAALVCTTAYGWDFYRYMTDETDYMVRDFYGALRVKPVGSGETRSLRLIHGVILHGEQFVDPVRRRLATTYYSPTSGIGRTLGVLRGDGRPLHVGSIGLGTGTLAAYGRAGDEYQIYEIDPQVVSVAREHFHYLSDSAARIRIVLGDARLSLEDEVRAGVFNDPENRFDVLSVDAFSSDAIPVHLITREALEVYAHAIKPDGVIAFHVSNRYLDLAPVVAQISAAAGFESLEIDDSPDDLLTYSVTDWVLVTRNRAFLEDPGIAPFGHPVPELPGLRLWTDQFNNLFQILH
jgi:SAM-dependent methyltransferase